jgi:hypothetical protein
MNRRQVLKLGAVAGGAVALGGVWRLGGRPASARTTDFERPPAAAHLAAGAMDSACSPTHFGASKVEITGVINSTRQVQKATGIDKVHAIVDGFHLAPAPDEIVAKTVAAFKEINPDYIIPMHCTGLNTIIAVRREVPKKLVMPSTGTRVIFGA